MPLSRHFYSLDEVHAALTYSSRRNDSLETLFWCQELILSGHIGETISTLFEAWLWHKGPFHLSWLQHAWSTLRSDTLTSDDILLSASHLSTIPYQQQDHSLWNILALSSDPLFQADRVTPKTPPWISPDIDAEELYFIRALYQGKAKSAWWMAQRWEEERVWSVLESYAAHRYPTSVWDALRNYEHLLGYRSPEYDMIIRCLAVLSCCLSLDQYEKSQKELPSQLLPSQKDALERWDTCVGYKKRRIYTIPTACLYGVTERGRQRWSHTNVRELNQLEPSLIGCPFWEEAIAEYGTIIKNRIQWNSDDDLEEFYDRYFPDDIPDEWTKAEKAVSHGDGVLGPTEVVTLFKYSRSTFSKWSRLAWNTRDLVQKQVEKKEWDGLLCSVYVPCIIETYDKKRLEPVHKRFIIRSYQDQYQPQPFV
jgi:hypothetical protein|uniref:Uncharacterized protein n=1 Tax=viral metagenome TaxID=1070528 RepID=A0A6C0BH15_9ZZZZ